jgi:hypothetical protein
MTARILAIADALVDALNTHPFSVGFVAERTYVPRHKVEDLATIAVSVVPKRRRTELLTPSATKRTHRIEIGIQRRVEADNVPAEMDPLVTLCEEIEAFVLGSSFAGAYCLEAEPLIGDDELFDWTHLETKKLFTWAFAATFSEGD